MSSATTSAPPMTSTHSRTARPTLWPRAPARRRRPSGRRSGRSRPAAAKPSGSSAPPRGAGFAGARLLGDHGRTVARAPWRSPASTPAAAAVTNESGSSAGPRPMVVTSSPKPVAASAPTGPTGTVTTVCGGGTLEGARCRRRGPPWPAGRPGADAVVVWWLRPRWRSRSSAPLVRAATTGRPPSAADGIDDRSDLDRGRAERRSRPDHAGAHAHDHDVGAGHPDRDVQG